MCWRLEHSRLVRRYVGVDGKIVSELVTATRPAVPVVEQEARPASAAGDSAVQRRAEAVMLAVLGQRLGVTLRPRRFTASDGVRVEVDGADEGLTVLVEAWAHQGPPKAAQKHKVLADAMRLLFVASTLRVPPRMLLCLSDQEAARYFTTARSWASVALRSFGIGIEVVDLPDELRGEIVAAQQRQYR